MIYIAYLQNNIQHKTINYSKNALYQNR